MDLGCNAPPKHTLPAGQPKHNSRAASRYVPGSHEAGICTTEPSGHVKPSPHSLQADAPSLLEYLPSGHALQSWLRSAAA